MRWSKDNSVLSYLFINIILSYLFIHICYTDIALFISI